MILLSTVGIFAIFQNSSFQTEGLWWATIECVGWVDESGQHRSGYPSGGELGVFYDGERIKGCDWTYTLKGSSGYPCQKWKVEMEIHWDSLSGPLIGSWSDSGGALATGDSVLAELDFNILLDQDKDVVAHFAGSIYNSQVGWETTVSGGRYCNVESNDPALSLESYSLDKTSVQPGDEVTATFSIKNSGRAASTNTKIA
ncbi:MAG: hypothetical protein NT163_12960, partial [Chlorobiales bacterium]|nr:hypothetical protein [Chlorobiales bacterium]